MQEKRPNPDSSFVDANRLDRIRSILTEFDLDGVVALSPANSYYATGFYAGMYSRPVVGVVTSETSVLICPRIERRKAIRTSWADKAYIYEDMDDPIEVVAAELESLPGNQFGIDRATARPEWVTRIEKRMDSTLSDASELFLTLRSVKTEWELDMIRRSQKLATAGIEALINGVESNRTELEVVSEVQQAYYDTYLEQFPEYDIGTANELGQYGFASVLVGDHALEPHSLSKSRRIETGDSVVGIALPSIQGYVCEEERTILVGEVPDKIYSAMETLIDVRNDTIDMIEAGIGVDEVDNRTAEALRDEGYGENIVTRTGHGEGITIHEGPSLNEQLSGTLESNMVISIEPGLYFPEEGYALRHSDTLIVTETGHERLTNTPDGVLTTD